MVLMLDTGLLLTRLAIRRQLEAMPHDVFLIRLIHHATRRAFPGERLWTATQLTSVATIRFLRIRNREGCDVYFQPYAENQNAGYILVDLDGADAAIVRAMRVQGHEPCVVLQTSPGHFQAWLHISPSPLEPSLATAVGKHMARTYGGDPASAGWRHLGRLAGFTNQKPQRRSPNGFLPWVKILHARAGLASHAGELLEAATARLIAERCAVASGLNPASLRQDSTSPTSLAPTEAALIYQSCIRRWRIAERFPHTDWSSVDL